MPCERARQVGLVGPEAILVCDVLAALEEALDRQSEKLLPEQLELQRKTWTQELMAAIEEAAAGVGARGSLDETQAQRRSMLDQLLKGLIDNKLVYEDAKKKIPSENFPKVEKQLMQQFEQVEIKKLMKKFEAESWRELDQRLRAHGSSFERERQGFMQRTLAQQWLRQQVKFDEEITLEQMLKFYREHPTDFDRPTRTRWQELSVSLAKFPTKKEAYDVIAQMGNQALGGADFAEVAKRGAEFSAGSDGSIREWPDKSRLVSAQVQKAIEGLAPGQMSPILEDWRGLHIIRVVDRQPACHLAFEAVQSEIRDKVRQQRTQEQIQTYLKRLKEEISVWTILDDATAVTATGRQGYPRR